MVAPVNTTGNIQSLQRLTPTSNTIQTVNRQPPQNPADNLPLKAQNKPVTIDLASANAQPNSNLPRGSIVDKLV